MPAEKFSNGLTDAQLERLYLLAEECAEVILAVSKITRHGKHSWNPILGGRTNIEDLERELGHVDHAVSRMITAGDVANRAIQRSAVEKGASIAKWLHHQE